MEDTLVPIHSPQAAEGEEQHVSLRSIKLRYGMMLLVVFLIALMFRWIPDTTKMLEPLGALNSRCDGEPYCLGTTMTLRLSFALFFFFMIHTILSTGWMRTCCGTGPFKAFVTEGYLVKIVLLGLLVLLTLFIPFDFFTGYGYFAFGASVLFLMIQTLVLLDFAYKWNEKWVPAEGYANDEEAKVFQVSTVCVTFFFFSGAITLVGLMYHWFAPDSCSSSEKSLHLFFITLTLLFGILGTLFSAYLDGGSVLISSFAFVYCAVLTYNAMVAGAKDDSCDLIFTDPKKINANTILSLLIAAVTVCHVSMSSGEARDAVVVHEIDEEYFSFSYFFACFCLGATYLAMILCNWEITTQPEHGPVLRAETSEASMWIQICTAWFTMLLFTWALVAPFCCGRGGFLLRDRDFS